jgi:hypothetical protein
MAKGGTTKELELLVDSHHGVYVPKVFVERYNLKEFGFNDKDIAYFKKAFSDPQSDDYFDAYEEMERKAITKDGSTITTAEGNLWLVPKGFNYDDFFYAEGGETDEDDLLKFTIPNWALTSLINGDDSGLEDEDIEKIDKFVKETVDEYGNANFMLPDESEMDLGFKRSNDIDNLGNDCSLLYLRPSKKYENGGETDEEENEEDENQQRLEELADEYSIPTEVIEEYASDRGIEISEITDLPYNGRYDSEEDYAEQMVDEGVVTDLSYYLEMYPTDMRILAQEEADRRVDDMDDDDLLSEADMEDEANEYNETKDEIDVLEDEISDLKSEIDDLFEDEDEDTTEGELQDKEDKAKELRDEIDEKENDLDRLQDKLSSLDSYDEVVDKAREELREIYYDDIHDALEKDAVGYFVDELGYNVEDLAKNNLFTVDYEKLARELGYDVLYIENGGDVYVFSNYERGGMTYAKGGGVDNYKHFELNSEGNFASKINGKNYEVIYRDDRTQMYDLFEDGKKIKSSKYVRDVMTFADGGMMAKGGNVRSLLSQFQKEKPAILIQMIADDVSSEFMRKKEDKTIVWDKLTDSEKQKYNEDYRENKFDFDKYLIYEFVKLYYSKDTIKNKCKGNSRATMSAIKSVMVSLAKEYPSSKYADGGVTKEMGKKKS